MPGPLRRLTVEAARDLVTERCFTPTGIGRVGLEYELLSFPVGDPASRIDVEALEAAVEAVPRRGGSRVTFEPGGQLELSGPACSGVGAAVDAMAADLAAVRAAAAEVGVELVGAGIDPVRPPQRLVHSPRYDAMEQFFDGDGAEGRTMMSSTASLQVNVDLGPSSDLEDRWRLAHAVSPVLAAAFANSPVVAGRPTGMRSSRLVTWSRLDRSRTAPGLGCSWADYALDATVLLVRHADGRYLPEMARQSFRQWIVHGHPLGWPDHDDLAYHLTTLFPPVRPRGWMEVRVVDSLPDPWWRVAATVTAALLDDAAAAAEARAATVDVAGLWVEAAHHGLAHPALAVAARRCFAAALDALGRFDVDAVTADACHEYVERYVARGRCPADDVLAEVQ